MFVVGRGFIGSWEWDVFWHDFGMKGGEVLRLCIWVFSRGFEGEGVSWMFVCLGRDCAVVHMEFLEWGMEGGFMCCEK